jgi:hypothetical protein
VLLVEVAQLALRLPGPRDQPRRGRLGAAQRRLRERVAGQQVVPVGVRDERAHDGEPSLLGDRGEDLQLVGEDGRVDDERLVARAHQRARGAVRPGDGDDDVRVQADGPHGR